MKPILTCAGVLAAAAVFCLSTESLARAGETITLNKAKGGTYMVMAYNWATRTYYYLHGNIESDSQKIMIPQGYGSTINLTKGRAIGSRNMYEKNDPVNPVFELKKKSSRVLKIMYQGKGHSIIPSSNLNPMILGEMPGKPFKRMSPP
ncbi:MAG: hypothetical protein HUN05_21695 [Desulfobacter sp.]|nr:MAG: hypothetical protein HUN05_21695 [Desulfobacter sp.]